MNITSILRKKTVLAACVAVGVLITGSALMAISKSPVTRNSAPVWGSQKECEAATHQSCGYRQCDYIPAGKTFEEVCGKDFQEGWQPILTQKD